MPLSDVGGDYGTLSSVRKAWYYPRIGRSPYGRCRDAAVPVIEKSRRALGDFLRSRREKLRPRDVGLADGRRRRTAGLRREEVAELAGIGVDWYVRLEQGRSVNPSISTINALARALKLSKVEHLHLKALTRSGERGAFQPET